MIIPKTFQIGGHTITVINGEEKYELRSNQRYGEFNSTKHEIRIGDILPTQREETYVHEVIEAISGIYNLDIPHPVINQLGIALHQALTSGKGELK